MVRFWLKAMARPTPAIQAATKPSKVTVKVDSSDSISEEKLSDRARAMALGAGRT